MMVIVLLVSSRALAVATCSWCSCREFPGLFPGPGRDLIVIILTVGVVATVYTMMGGIRAVVWTDVIQVALLLGGGFFTIGYVAWATGTNLWDWMEVVNLRDNESFTFFSPDPTLPATVVTFTLTDALWIVVAHCANQMTMQRYFSTVDVAASKRSMVTGAVTGIIIILVLTIVGASLVYYFTQGPEPLPGHIDLANGKDRDSIFPFFVASRVPAGLAGAIFAALLAAAMSTIDSGVNSFATVATVDFGRLRKKNKPVDEVRQARIITLVVGLAVMMGALSLENFTGSDDILTILPKTFNSLVGPMGGLFLAGMFLPRAGRRTVWPAAIIGFLTALGVAYSQPLLQVSRPLGPADPGGAAGRQLRPAADREGDGIHLDHALLLRRQLRHGLDPEPDLPQPEPAPSGRTDLEDPPREDLVDFVRTEPIAPGNRKR